LPNDIGIIERQVRRAPFVLTLMTKNILIGALQVPVYVSLRPRLSLTRRNLVLFFVCDPFSYKATVFASAIVKVPFNFVIYNLRKNIHILLIQTKIFINFKKLLSNAC
jgi:hypothetical protein